MINSNIVATGNVTLFIDIDGNLHGFGPQAEIIMTPRDLFLSMKEKRAQEELEKQFGYLCTRVPIIGTEKYYTKARGPGYGVTTWEYTLWVPDEDGYSSTQATEDDFKQARLVAKESREQEQESHLDGLRALLSENATYVQVRQPMGESIQTRSFWTVLTG